MMTGPEDDDEVSGDAASPDDGSLDKLPPWGGGCEDGCC